MGVNFGTFKVSFGSIYCIEMKLNFLITLYLGTCWTLQPCCYCNVNETKTWPIQLYWA